jgi:hypothetical protein
LFYYAVQFSKNSLSLFESGGDERIRTADPLLARQVLSQLSYTPVCDVRCEMLEVRLLLEFASGEFLLFPLLISHF